MNHPLKKVFASAPSGMTAPAGGDSQASAAYTAAKEEMIRSISSWKGVTVHEHRFGGVQFRVGRRELGHLHPAFADLPFPRFIRDELIASGHAKLHHVLPDSGWITAPMRNSAEVAAVIELFRQNYERAVKAGETSNGDLE